MSSPNTSRRIEPARVVSMPASQSIGRRLLLTGVALVLILELSLGARHPLANFSLITLAGALVFAALNHKHDTWRSALLCLLQGVGIATIARMLSLDNWIAALLPALVQAVLAGLVARTLLPGKVPAIRRIAAALHTDGSPLPPDIDVYTRWVTWTWVMTFIGLAIMNATVVLYSWQPDIAPLAWSLIDVTVVATVIVVEFLYRRQRYPAYTLNSLSEFWRDLQRLDPRSILLS
jgi:uncharacterized membrane protein